MQFPKHIQQAVDLGLLQAEGNQIVGVGAEEAETVLGIARLMEKIQPTTKADTENTEDQESIVLCRVLTSPSGLARELWSDLRIAVGVGHGQSLPRQLWSTDILRAVGGLIDRIYTNEANGVSLISKDSLIAAYPNNSNQYTSIIEFNQAVSTLAELETMKSYGDASSEWDVALDLLRQARAKATFQKAQHLADQAVKSDSKLEKAIEAQQQELMTCLGMLRGSVGNQGNAVDAIDDLLNPKDGRLSFIDTIMSAREQSAPISTGIAAMDLDMEGGVRGPGEAAGGRLFTLAARTGVGKTVLGVYTAVNLAMGGLKVGLISAELDKHAIYARVWSAATRIANKGPENHHGDQTYDSNGNPAGRSYGGWVMVGDIESPNETRKTVSQNIVDAAGAIQGCGGKLLIEDPWGADVETVVNSLRSMKAKNPDLRCAIVDHFHVLARHKGAPASEAAMLEERAYKLMNCAKQLEIDLIVLAQMNRIGMDPNSSTQPPSLDQIRGTDALSHVSHAVWIVRRQPGSKDENANNSGRPLELWHSKTRGRQAYWDGTQIKGFKGFLDHSLLEMDYAFCSVKKDSTVMEIKANR